MRTNKTEIRRKNREIKDEQWIKDYLHNARYGAFSTCDDEQAFINWNLFIYDEINNAIYFHTARNGRTRSNIEKNPRICFSIADIGDIVLAKKAVDFSVQYKSIIIFGNANIVTDDDLLMSVFKLYFNKYVKDLKVDIDYLPFNLEDAKRATLYRMNIEEWSAKMNNDKSYHF